jgi:signal transduction histidine kinase
MFFGNSRNHATGMGLFLCRQLCKKLGHGIAVESKESVGTKVCITFPKGSMTEVNKA